MKNGMMGLGKVLKMKNGTKYPEKTPKNLNQQNMATGIWKILKF
jgi:hypothetical protein